MDIQWSMPKTLVAAVMVFATSGTSGAPHPTSTESLLGRSRSTTTSQFVELKRYAAAAKKRQRIAALKGKYRGRLSSVSDYLAQRAQDERGV